MVHIVLIYVLISMLINLTLLANEAPVTIVFGIIFSIENTKKPDAVKHATKC